MRFFLIFVLLVLISSFATVNAEVCKLEYTTGETGPKTCKLVGNSSECEITEGIFIGPEYEHIIEINDANKINVIYLPPKLARLSVNNTVIEFKPKDSQYNFTTNYPINVTITHCNLTAIPDFLVNIIPDNKAKRVINLSNNLIPGIRFNSENLIANSNCFLAEVGYDGITKSLAREMNPKCNCNAYTGSYSLCKAKGCTFCNDFFTCVEKGKKCPTIVRLENVDSQILKVTTNLEIEEIKSRSEEYIWFQYPGFFQSDYNRKDNGYRGEYLRPADYTKYSWFLGDAAPEPVQYYVRAVCLETIFNQNNEGYPIIVSKSYPMFFTGKEVSEERIPESGIYDYEYMITLKTGFISHKNDENEHDDGFNEQLYMDCFSCIDDQGKPFMLENCYPPEANYSSDCQVNRCNGINPQCESYYTSSGTCNNVEFDQLSICNCADLEGKQIKDESPVTCYTECVEPNKIGEYCSNLNKEKDCNEFPEDCRWHNGKCINKNELPKVCSTITKEDECQSQKYCEWCSVINKCATQYTCPKCDALNQSQCKVNKLNCNWCEERTLCLETNDKECECESIKTGIVCQESNVCEVNPNRNEETWDCELIETQEKKHKREDQECSKVKTPEQCATENCYWCAAEKSCSKTIHKDKECDCINFEWNIDKCLSREGCKLCPSTLKCTFKLEAVLNKLLDYSCTSCEEATNPQECSSFENCKMCNGECVTKQTVCKSCLIHETKENCDSSNSIECSFCESTQTCSIQNNKSNEVCLSCSEISSNDCTAYSNGCKTYDGACVALAHKEETKSIFIILIPVVCMLIVIVAALFVVFLLNKKKSNINIIDIEEHSSYVTLNDLSSSQLSKMKDFAQQEMNPHITEEFVEVEELEQLQITLEPQEIEFLDEQTSNEDFLKVNTEYSIDLNIQSIEDKSNKSKKSKKSKRPNKCEIAFAVINKDRNTLHITPNYVKQKSNQTTTINLKLTMKASGTYNGFIKVANCSKKIFYKLPVKAQAAASCFLSLDEVKLGKKIGAGANGSVYIGEHKGIPVAIKELKVEELSLGETDAFIEIDKEVLMMAKLKSPYIVEFYGIAYTPTYTYTVMELCRYGTLTAYLEKNKSASTTFRLLCCLDSARALLYLHHLKIIHRDIKPDNLLMVSTSETAPVRVKISDFGTSRLVTNENAQNLTSATGTPIFMAPEVLEGKLYSLPADVYSMGLTFWSIFTGKLPFSHEKNQFAMYELICKGEIPEIPKECPISDLIKRCCALETKKRPKTKEMMHTIESVLESRGMQISKTKRSKESGGIEMK